MANVRSIGCETSSNRAFATSKATYDEQPFASHRDQVLMLARFYEGQTDVLDLEGKAVLDIGSPFDAQPSDESLSQTEA